MAIIDKMKPLQMLYNLDKAGVKVPGIGGTPFSTEFDKNWFNHPEAIKEWAEKILNDNKELFKNQSKEEFINFVIYGR